MSLPENQESVFISLVSLFSANNFEICSLLSKHCFVGSWKVYCVDPLGIPLADYLLSESSVQQLMFSKSKRLFSINMLSHCIILFESWKLVLQCEPNFVSSQSKNDTACIENVGQLLPRDVNSRSDNPVASWMFTHNALAVHLSYYSPVTSIYRTKELILDNFQHLLLYQFPIIF